MPPLLEDCALNSAFIKKEHEPEDSVELNPRTGGLLRKASLPASNGGVVLDRPHLRRKLNVFLCVCCATLPILPNFVSPSHRINEGRFSINGGVGKQRHHLIRVAIDPGPAIFIQPILNFLFRHLNRPGLSRRVGLSVSNRLSVGLPGSIGGPELCWRGDPEAGVEPLAVVPVHPSQGGEVDVFAVVPRPLAAELAKCPSAEKWTPHPRERGLPFG